jgi:hypothetical protein
MLRCSNSLDILMTIYFNSKYQLIIILINELLTYLQQKYFRNKNVYFEFMHNYVIIYFDNIIL